MGSPLGPVLADLFMAHHEREWLSGRNNPFQPLYYRRYVDDIFCMFTSKGECDEFFKFINKQHSNIKFTMEEEQNGKLPFLDVFVSKTDSGKFSTTTFRKSTFTGLFTNFHSFTSFRYKTGLVNTLFDRAYKINSSFNNFLIDIKSITGFLEKNNFPRTLLDRLIDKFNKLRDHCQMQQQQHQLQPSSTGNTENGPETHYFKLPYTGRMSKHVETVVNKLVLNLCRDIKVKLVFIPTKIGTYFSTKDPVSSVHKASVVYKFSCASCNACYIGETSRHYTTRLTEHLKSDKSSHVFKHLQNSPTCRDVCDSQCFKIIDYAPTKYQLKIKEGLHIHWEKPSLNKQLYSYNITLLV